MDVRQLEYFLAVVDHGGFNRAASALYLASLPCRRRSRHWNATWAATSSTVSAAGPC